MKGSEKINQVLAEVGLKPAAFARSIGLKAAQNVYDIQKDKVDISKDVASRIVAQYPCFNFDWLLTGKGKMIKSDTVTAPSDNENVTIPRSVWQVIEDQAASLKAKDQQMSELISLLKEQMKKGGLVSESRSVL